MHCKTIKIFTFLFLNFIFVFSFGQNTKIDTCITIKKGTEEGMDAYLASYAPDVNFAYHIDFGAVGWTCNGSLCIGRSLLRFDFSELPNNAVLTSAKLNLYASSQPFSNGGQSAMLGNNKSFLMRVTENWNYTSVNWDNQPATTIENQIELSQSSTPTQDYLQVDVLEMINIMRNTPNNNFGFMIKLENEVFYNNMIFASSDFTDANKHPSIEICYEILNSTLYKAKNNDLFRISPNPITNLSKITLIDGSNESYLLKIIDIYGKVLDQKTLTKEQINQLYFKELFKDNITNGLYFLEVSNGNYSYSKKIIIN